MISLPSDGGVVRIDKPAGPTSHDVVARTRKALDIRKIGHTGTLDPFASGLLLLCVGRATRLSEYLMGLEKEYLATVRLGARTDTLDPEGEVVAHSEGWRELTAEAVREAVVGLRGVQSQRPPAYSAKKVGGEAAHRRVRRGETVALVPVEVTVHVAEVTKVELPDVELRIRCSRGTYVRALARDLGEALGVGGYLTALRRTAVGSHRVDEAAPGDRLTPEAVRAAWITPAAALAHLPSLGVSEEECRLLAHGRSLKRTPDAGDEGREGDAPFALLRDGTQVAVGVREGTVIRPRKVFLKP